MIEGIDVSAANPVPDFSKVPDDFVFEYIRASHGKAIDGRLSAHWNAAILAERLCGSYSFEEPDDDPRDEAKAWIDSGAVHMVLPPTLDCEWLGGRTPSQVLKYTTDYLEELESQLGRVPVLYTGPGFWSSLGPEAKHPRFKRYPLWIAHYGVTKPMVPAPWDTWTFWQHAANTIVLSRGQQLFGTPARKALAEDPQARVIAQPGLVPGVVGEVDCNKFNGTIDDLKKLAGLV